VEGTNEQASAIRLNFVPLCRCKNNQLGVKSVEMKPYTRGNLWLEVLEGALSDFPYLLKSIFGTYKVD
jgi:hypothetical protein